MLAEEPEKERICIIAPDFPLVGGMRSVIMILLQLLSKEAEPVVLSRKWGDSAYTHFDLSFSPRIGNWFSPWFLSSLPLYVLSGFLWVVMLRLQGVRKFLVQDSVFSGLFTLLVCKVTGGELYLFDYGSAVNLDNGLLERELNIIQPAPMTRIQLRIMRIIRLLSILSAKLFFVHSAEMKTLALNLGLSPDRVVEYRNPVNLEMFQRDARARARLRKSLGVGRAFCILYLGRLTLDKGLPLLIDAYRVLGEQAPGHVRLLIIGEGPEEAKLREYCKELDIVFLRAVNDPVKVAEYLSAADAFVYPAVFGSGVFVAVLEAMACELPVIVGPGSGTKDVILERENGFVMREAKPSYIIEAVTYLLKHPKVRDGIGRRARETVVDEFDVDQYERAVVERILSP